jgi:hypothetical protein
LQLLLVLEKAQSRNRQFMLKDSSKLAPLTWSWWVSHPFLDRPMLLL